MELHMINKNTYIKNSLIVCSLLLLVACGKEDTAGKINDNFAEDVVKTATNDKTPESKVETTKKEVPNKAAKEETVEAIAKEDKESKVAEVAKVTSTKAEEISWDKLIPADYDPNEAINGYIEQLEKLEDGDQEAMEIYGKIQAELDNAPVNMSMNGKNIKMPGFIAPLENQNGVIDEFLLVPYFGACIHSPPPPMNQTVMVKAKKGTGVKSEDSSYPVWITGKLVAVEERTTIGAAGYRIENPVIEPYEEENN